MAFFQVTASELRAKAEELKGLNGSFKGEVRNLETIEGALKSKWVGQANDNFHAAFVKDKGQMDNFYKLVENYIAALLQIAAQYEKTESANAEVARTRNY